MKLTRIERALLVNQLELRKAVEKTDDYDNSIEILRNGYEIFYEDALGHVYRDEETLNSDECKFVLDVLTMYRWIEAYKAANQSDEEVRNLFGATFSGFDGNNEGAHLSFTRFLIEHQRKFAEQQPYAATTDDFNSHAPTLSRYAEYLQRFRACGKVWEAQGLSREQVLSICGHTPANG